MKKTKLGLLGKNIAHSKSQAMYEQLLLREITYELIDCETKEEIPSLKEIFLSNEGLSITTPYKEFFLNECFVTEEIKQLGAINCIRKKNNNFEATNTDFLAIDEILKKKIKKYPSLFIVILGDGVMARVLSAVCIKNKIEFDLYSRKKNINFESVSYKKIYTKNNSQVLIINACSRKFIFKNEIAESFHFWDLNYAYSPHHYLKRELALFEDGLDLLRNQARFALSFWSIK